MKQKACDTGRTLSNVAAVALGNAFPEIGLFDDLRPEPAPVVETTKQRLDRYIEEHRRRARETADAADQETEARPPEI